MVAPIYDTFELGIVSLVVSLLLSYLVSMRSVWAYRKPIAALNSMFIGLSSGFLILYMHPVLGIIFAAIQTMRLFVALRIVKDRLPAPQSFARSRRSERSLIFWAIIAIVTGICVPNVDNGIVLALAILQLGWIAVLYRHTLYMRRTTAVRLPKKFQAPADLPSITIAIPARNQTNDLEDCLRSILRLNYPKLEILVLDDCSQDKTSDIIRSFAHKGVRFLKGSPPPPSWIAKNWAYDQLLDNASGELIVFCGTDVRFEPQSLRVMVESFTDHNLSMLSVLPIREPSFDSGYVLQPMRYYRELVFLSPFQRFVPALSTCWIAKRKMLIKHGGFEALRKSIRPERIIACGVAQNGNYAFVRASSGLAISSVKPFSAQWRTAARTRYPELKSRPESVLSALMIHVFVFIGPFISLLYGLFQLHVLIIFLSVVAISYLWVIHLNVSYIVSGAYRPYTILLYPISLTMEIAVMLYSMWAYEFSEVIWKGRNVCMPVLKTNLRLPKLD